MDNQVLLKKMKDYLKRDTYINESEFLKEFKAREKIIKKDFKHLTNKQKDLVLKHGIDILEDV